MAAKEVVTAQQRPADEHVVIFQLGEESFGLDIQAVQEIVRMQSITAIPGSADWMKGITNLRGRVVPVIDLRRRFGMANTELTPATRIVVVTSVDGMVGLVVDAVSEVLRIPGEQVEAPGMVVNGPGNAYLRGIAKLSDRLVSLMDLAGVLPAGAEAKADTDDGANSLAA